MRRDIQYVHVCRAMYVRTYICTVCTVCHYYQHCPHPNPLQDVSPMNQPGVDTKRTVLNVFGPMGHGGRYILDSLKVCLLASHHSGLCTSMCVYAYVQ